MSEFSLPEAGGDTNIIICICHLYEAGHFSYSESPRTPPLEGTSLHRWNNSVERPWGIWACLRPFHDYEWFQPATGCMWHRHVGSLWSKPHGAVCFSYHGSARGGRGGGGGYLSIFPISNGCHTSTWHTSELNNDHVLGNNTWTCGLRSILKHNAWGYISCHFNMTTQLHQPQKSKVNRSWGVWNVHLSLIPIWLPKSVLLLSIGAKNQVWIHFEGDAEACIHKRF